MVGALVTRLVEEINKENWDTVDGAIMAADIFLIAVSKPSYGCDTVIPTRATLVPRL